MKRVAAGAARVVRTTAEVIAAAAKRRPNIAAKTVMERVLPVRRGRQRKPVPQTAVTRNAAVRPVRVHKVVNTAVRPTVRRVAVLISVRNVMRTTVITGRQSAFREMPAVQAIMKIVQPNVPLGCVIRDIQNQATAASVRRLVRIR